MSISTAASDIEGSLVPMQKMQAVLMLEASQLWMDMGRFDAAREIISSCVTLMPKSDVPQLLLGTLEFAEGRFEKALQAYRQAQRLSPKAGVPRAHAGEVLLFMGKVSEAMKELKQARQLDPEGDGARLAACLAELVGSLLVNVNKQEPVPQNLGKLNQALKKVKSGPAKALETLINDVSALTGIDLNSVATT